MRTVWDIPNNKHKDELAYGKHPTQKPERLVFRMLDVSAPPEGLVLVPFAGSGTECVASRKRKLDFIGIELSADYVKIAEARLKALERQGRLLL